MVLVVGGLLALGALIVVGAVVMAVLTAFVSVGTLPFVAVLVGIERAITAVQRRLREVRSS